MEQSCASYAAASHWPGPDLPRREEDRRKTLYGGLTSTLAAGSTSLYFMSVSVEKGHGRRTRLLSRAVWTFEPCFADR